MEQGDWCVDEHRTVVKLSWGCWPGQPEDGWIKRPSTKSLLPDGRDPLICGTTGGWSSGLTRCHTGSHIKINLIYLHCQRSRDLLTGVQSAGTNLTTCRPYLRTVTRSIECSKSAPSQPWTNPVWGSGLVMAERCCLDPAPGLGWGWGLLRARESWLFKCFGKLWLHDFFNLQLPSPRPPFILLFLFLTSHKFPTMITGLLPTALLLLSLSPPLLLTPSPMCVTSRTWTMPPQYLAPPPTSPTWWPPLPPTPHIVRCA